ncbi:MAG: two-component regulator propeller domain-containing protein [Chitinophagales bacterium]
MLHKRSYRSLVLCLFLSAHFVHAQNLQPDFQHLDIDAGLSDYTIYCFAQDTDGFIWFGTRNGLGRYDGYHIKTYYNDPTRKNSLPGNVVYALLCDKNNTLWVGIDNGLCRFDKQKELFERIPVDESIQKPLSVHAICQTSTGDIWVGTDHGLYLFNTEVGKLVSVKTNPPEKSLSANIIDLACDAQDRILYTGYFGLGVFDPAHGKIWTYSDMVPQGSSIRNIALGKNNSIWLSTYSGELWRTDGDGKILESFSCAAWFPSLDWDIRRIAVDAQNRIWIADFTNGLFVADPDQNTLQRFTYAPYLPNSIKNNSVLGLFITDDHTVWFSEGGAVSHFSLQAKPFHYLHHDPSVSLSLTDNWVRSFCADGDGNIWAATVQGISIFDPKTNSIIKNIRYDSVNHSTLPGSSVRALASDASGKIWIGGSGGIVSYGERTKKFSKYKIIKPEHCSANPTFIWSLLATDDGTVYAGSGCGVFRYDAQYAAFVPMDSALHTTGYNADVVRALYASSDNKIWIGYGKMVMVFDPATKKQVLLNDQIHSDVINAFAEDDAHRMWISARNGLFCFDPATQKSIQYTTNDGLPNIFCGGILIASNGHVWVSNGAGLSVLDVQHNSWHTFDKSDGIFCLPLNDQSGFADNNGYFYFAGREGLVYFDPEKITLDQRPPNVLCAQFTILDSSMCTDYLWHGIRNLDLPHNKNFISFELSALSYEHSEENTYAYFLAGFDTKWNYTGSRRFATYTDLPPGTYTLQAKAANHDGTWSDAVTIIHLHIRLPFWRTWWFIALCILCITACLYGIYRVRINQLLALQKVRNRIARDLHDDIGASLSSIRLYSESVKRKLEKENTESGDVLDKIAANAKEVVENMGIIVWAINPVNDSLKNLVQKLHIYAAEMCALQNMELQYASEHIPDLKLSMEVRKNIFLILREAIHNAVKYAESNTLHVHIMLHGKQMHCRVSDTGKGIDAQTIQSGNGLKNMRSRAAEIGAQLEWTSRPGEGTTLTMLLDIP